MKSGKGTRKHIVFDGINHVGDAHCSIFSVSKLKQRGSIVHFEKGNDYILLADGTRVDLVEDNGLYYFHLEQIISPEEIDCMVAMTKPHLRPKILGNGVALAANIDVLAQTIACFA